MPSQCWFLGRIRGYGIYSDNKNSCWYLYVIFFLLLMSLELFVVTSKMGDEECDYELAIKGAERVKMAQFNSAFSKVSV